MIGMGLPRIQILFLLMETSAHQGFTYSLLKGWATKDPNNKILKNLRYLKILKIDSKDIKNLLGPIFFIFCNLYVCWSVCW